MSLRAICACWNGFRLLTESFLLNDTDTGAPYLKISKNISFDETFMLRSHRRMVNIQVKLRSRKYEADLCICLVLQKKEETEMLFIGLLNFLYSFLFTFICRLL